MSFTCSANTSSLLHLKLNKVVESVISLTLITSANSTQYTKKIIIPHFQNRKWNNQSKLYCKCYACINIYEILSQWTTYELSSKLILCNPNIFSKIARSIGWCTMLMQTKFCLKVLIVCVLNWGTCFTSTGK